MKQMTQYGLWLVFVGTVGWLGFGVSGWLFAVGVVIAWGLGLVDRMIYAWWLYPFEQTSIQIQYWTRKRDIRAVFNLLMRQTESQQKLIFRSVGFSVVWILLALFVASSTGNIVAMGIVMGLGFGLVQAILKDWRSPDRLAQWYCWQIKRQVSGAEARRWGGVFMVAWLWFVIQISFF